MPATRPALVVLVLVTLVATLLAAPATAGRGRPRPGPDLTVASISVAARVQQGRPLTVTAVVRNAGRTKARATVTRFALSTDRRAGGDRALAPVRATPALRPERATKVTAQVTVPDAVTPGGYWVVACADATRRVKERKEGDNCRVSAGRWSCSRCGRATS